MALQTVVHLWSQVSFLCHTKKVCRTIRSHQDDCPGAYFPRILYISHQSHNHSSLSVSVVAHSGIWDPEYLRKHVLSSSSSRFLPPAALCSTVASPGGWLCSERSSCVLQRRLSPWRHVPDAAEASRGSFLSCPRAADWCNNIHDAELWCEEAGLTSHLCLWLRHGLLSLIFYSGCTCSETEQTASLIKGSSDLTVDSWTGGNWVFSHSAMLPD